MAQRKAERRESYAGFHFFNLGQDCKRKFFLRYVMRLQPEHYGWQLVFGGAFHEGKSTWYARANKTLAIKKAVQAVEEEVHKLEEPDKADWLIERVQILLGMWIDTHGKSDLKHNKVLETEVQSYVDLGYTLGKSPIIMTVRPDAILKRKHEDAIVIMETKTSGFSYAITELAVYMGDQSTSYIAAARQKYPQYRLIGVQPDIAYWNKTSDNVKNIKLIRTEIVTRNKEDIQAWKDGTADTITDLSARVAAYKTGRATEHQAFPRNTTYCYAYGRKCEFYDICRGKVSAKGRAPAGFKRDQRQRLQITRPVGVET